MEQHTLFNLVALGCYIGPCVSKYTQTMDKNVDYHVYPSGKQVIKAFTANDFQFFDENSQVITELSDTSIKVVDRVCITWSIQKNHQNNQLVTLLSDKTNTAIAPFLPQYIWCSEHVAFCYPKKDALAYISGSRIAILFRAAARAVRPNIVWACVLLNKAGKLPDYIKKCLRWMSDSFRMYLHDMRINQDQHREAF